MTGHGVTPEQLLSDFRELFDATPQTLRGLAAASEVGIETIRGWKDEGRFPRSTDDFLRVVQICLRSLGGNRPVNSWSQEEWEIRYHEAKLAWENRPSDRRQPKRNSSTSVPLNAPGVQVTNGDYVAGGKNSVHIGNEIHHYHQKSD